MRPSVLREFLIIVIVYIVVVIRLANVAAPIPVRSPVLLALTTFVRLLLGGWFVGRRGLHVLDVNVPCPPPAFIA